MNVKKRSRLPDQLDRSVFRASRKIKCDELMLYIMDCILPDIHMWDSTNVLLLECNLFRPIVT
jgi:hypothetical protein